MSSYFHLEPSIADIDPDLEDVLPSAERKEVVADEGTQSPSSQPEPPGSVAEAAAQSADQIEGHDDDDEKSKKGGGWMGVADK